MRNYFYVTTPDGKLKVHRAYKNRQEWEPGDPPRSTDVDIIGVGFGRSARRGGPYKLEKMDMVNQKYIRETLLKGLSGYSTC